ncbi:conserved hypothetical protein [Treponema phagedenis]|uniref:Uncharacterized protein n=2 Tax=Treponema phagedenis TaxID=162 RepID=A0A0B7GZU7_TREPH|nr:conserved hypothetical protein [Treponema phagedenis]
MFNSKRCFKASTQNCNIEALKLASTINKNAKTTFRTGTDARGSTQQRWFSRLIKMGDKIGELHYAYGKLLTVVKNSEPPRTAVVLNRIEFENYHSVLGVFKLIGLVLPWTAKIRTATDGSGSNQKRCLKTPTQILNRSFQTHRFGFAMDGKTQNRHGRRWF